MSIVIFDLDGTLADLTHRLHHIQKKPKDWPSFFAECEKDKSIEPVARLLRSLCSMHQIYVFSGRSEDVRDQTEGWLADHSLQPDKLIMRKSGDFRADDVVKKEFLDALSAEERENIWFVVDDRKRVVDMWRANGLTVLQCAEGEF